MQVRGESGGNPHLDLSQGALPPEGELIEAVWVCVVTHENGGEAIYGQHFGSLFVNFVTESEKRKQQMDAMLQRQGTLSVIERLGKKIEWRRYWWGRDEGP